MCVCIFHVSHFQPSVETERSSQFFQTYKSVYLFFCFYYIFKVISDRKLDRNFLKNINESCDYLLCLYCSWKIGRPTAAYPHEFQSGTQI